MPPRPPSLCLNMIVKDEAPIIERLVDSVAPVVSYYVVCDTGSSDNTTDILRARFAERGIDGEVHNVPFVNFSQARNAALRFGRDSRAHFDYFLLADADMELVVEDDRFPERLSADAYSIRQHSGTLSYFNPRLLNRKSKAEYKGATHEYLQTQQIERLEGISFKDHACGSSRHLKTTRDTALLLEALKDDPDDARSLFYLAQTCRDAGLFREAAAWYDLRCKAGGFAEEVWYARYQKALCHAKLGEEEKFISDSLRAFEDRPHRAEPLFQLAQYHRFKGRSQSALMFAQAAANIPYPEGDSLFIDEEAYSSGIAEEISISGYYAHSKLDQQKGRAACFALSVDTQAPDQRVWTARRNCYYYAQSARELFGEVAITELSIDVPPGRTNHNPSVAHKDGQLFCIVRSANYRRERGLYFSNDSDGIIRTENYITQLNDNLQIESHELIRTGSENRPYFPCHVQGYEDCRLFHVNGKWYCVATVLDANPNYVCEMVLLTLSADWHIEKTSILSSPDEWRHEKNWIPLVADDQLLLIYSTDPLVIFRCDTETGKLEKISDTKASATNSFRLDHLRGGSQAISIDDGWLYVTHEVIDGVGEHNRAYLHRFVFLDKHLKLKGVSDPFVFIKSGTEFCAGMVLDSSRARLLLSFGQEDQSALVMSIDANSVLAQLHRS
jgi:glycosyltransferase involved in cell wall biosynthesis/predicted GH43/DUF377 family glycosyl hydrolase